MDQQFFDFVDRIEKLPDLDSLRHQMGNELGRLGFHQFAYLAVRDSDGPEVPYVVTSYPDEWGILYGERDYVNFDPVVEHASETILPFDWLSLSANRPVTPKQREVFYHATDFGIQNGITVPIHGPNLALASLSVTADASDTEFAGLFRKYRHQIHLMALYYHSAIERHLVEAGMPTVRLSDREKECLLWTSRGKTAWEISEILDISQDTVIFHLRNVTQKIGVYSKHHAVVKALLLGIIHP